MIKHPFIISTKTYSQILIGFCVLITIVFWGMSIYLDPIEGDLTRIGGLSENSFGWTKSQPALAAELLNNSPLADADVAVIGDSFSATFVWQTRLVQAGYKVNTAYNVDVPWCSDLGDLLRQSGFTGKYVVIEAVERLFQHNLNNQCQKSPTYKTLNIGLSAVPPVNREIKHSLLDSGTNFGVGWNLKAFFYDLFLYAKSKSPTPELISIDKVRLYNLGDCRLFSNKLCQLGLFWSEDFATESFRSLDRVLEINKNFEKNGIQAIWVVVPDKSTVYMDYGAFRKNPYVNIWNELGKHPELNALNYAEMFKRQAQITQDFYLPNNSHVGTVGYLFLGDTILKTLQHLSDPRP
ncbi:hypothetical protein NP590_08700 [Methylomonas sp. SURF-2]|uniref:AlgX/AlgJ SGNH hydrolase-like domain-containing protein n=1 Tax=Methylomonas subterranea TaxID=2952225 RepID=A0ABT1TFD6_9GAMM|nr:hypothetical protein [Methylomonas sp. SURF-2]MCQ8104181.1 hypothetical protein [Methylomonas sp. SURF-2]